MPETHVNFIKKFMELDNSLNELGVISCLVAIFIVVLSVGVHLWFY